MKSILLIVLLGMVIIGRSMEIHDGDILDNTSWLTGEAVEGHLANNDFAISSKLPTQSSELLSQIDKPLLSSKKKKDK